MSRYVKEIIDAQWHRNGVCGVGFWAITFIDRDNGPMVATLFDESGYCAVLGINLLSKGNVRFGENSWRGDHYESELRPMLKEWCEKNESNRFGPFSAIPKGAIEEFLSQIHP